MFNVFLGVLLIVFGIFFISLGMLFISYEKSPLRRFVREEDVFTNFSLGLKIMIPGLILFYLASIVFSK